ncbi:MAG: hypothetical protein ACI9DC_005246 [Gammaproteobacteria bacterium]|jgi:hypothetical protein
MLAKSVKDSVLAEIDSTETNKLCWDCREYLLDEPESCAYRKSDESLSLYWCVLREPDQGYHILTMTMPKCMVLRRLGSRSGGTRYSWKHWAACRMRDASKSFFEKLSSRFKSIVQ